MAEKKNKRIKSIGHRPTTPKMKKEKELTKGVPSVKGKWVHVLLHLLLHQR